MTNDLLDGDSMRVYEEPFESLGFRFVAAHYDPATQQIHVELKNGLKISFPREVSRALKNASDADLQEIEINEWAIDFPRIDNGFSLEPLAFGDFGNAPWNSAFLKQFEQKKKEHLSAA